MSFLRSNTFYKLILLIFVFEALWIAVSAAYPQAFDENFHFGLIKVYSHYWLPFFTSQPPHADAYGAVAHDPSYLYHYLMSFPFRFIELFTKRQIVQVVFLRVINVALFTWAIILFRKVLLRVGASTALVNLSLMLFVLIPIVPQLAAQINYDNLMIPLTALSLLLAFRIVDEVKAKKPSVMSFALMICLGLLTGLVKYAYLPILTAIVIFLFIIIWQSYRHELNKFFNNLKNSWKEQKPLYKIFIVIAVIVPIGMFLQRDGLNLVEYHSIEPDCSKILTVKQCSAYSPWEYNYKNHQKLLKEGTENHYQNILAYTVQWLYWMWYRLFFAVNGPNSHFKNYPPLPLPSFATLVLMIIGVIALLKFWRKLFTDRPRLILLFFVACFYSLVLFGQGYYTYKYTAVLENMNGRYLLPVLLMFAVVFGESIGLLFRNKQKRKIILALVALLFFLEGGGLITFIARSDPSWDVDNKTIVKVNNTARKVVKKIVITGKKRYTTSVWFLN